MYFSVVGNANPDDPMYLHLPKGSHPQSLELIRRSPVMDNLWLLSHPLTSPDTQAP